MPILVASVAEECLPEAEALGWSRFLHSAARGEVIVSRRVAASLRPDELVALCDELRDEPRRDRTDPVASGHESRAAG